MTTTKFEPATDLDVERLSGGNACVSIGNFWTTINSLCARIKSDAEQLDEYRGIVQRLEEGKDGWLPPEVVAKVEGILQGADTDGHYATRGAAIRAAINAIRSAKGAPAPAPEVSKSEAEIDTLAMLRQHEHDLADHSDRIRRLEGYIGRLQQLEDRLRTAEVEQSIAKGESK